MKYYLKPRIPDEYTRFSERDANLVFWGAILSAILLTAVIGLIL